ncbi:transcriptional regulator [Pseudomonas sp. CFBP13506]|uniref:helix-turn-helix domain-containing protein n=1 Tax=Pseudomonas sp. CFBP13506 TaxID=2184010 RepID=UPI0010C042C2|nr:helix-turn-helix domain-containing protein [Pseudomonas sp. CFBP13506]TKJ63980.1 transcriptional regulator [Pseudomonas sp. CFBP13506]
MTISARLKEERTRLKLSQTDLGAVGGVGKTTQINYEKGVGAPDATYLAAVAELGVDVLYVVTGDRKPVPTDSISADAAELLKAYEHVSDADRQVLLRMAAAFAAVSGFS